MSRVNYTRPNRFRFMLAVTAGIVLLSAPQGHAAPGVTPNEVVVGMSNALSGPAAALGAGVRKGAEAYFNKINAGGGVHGRRIRLISYDDTYEPKLTVPNTVKLIHEDKVFALFGYVGTPTSSAVIPLINKNQIPFFGPFTGAEFLRNPVNRHIFNVRSSYFDEAEAQVQYLIQHGINKIGVFLQNDSYGLAVKGGIIKALRARNMTIAGEGLYTRNTEVIGPGLAELRKAQPEAISMVGTYKAMAEFIKTARAEQFNPVFLNVSFVGTAALIKELGKAGEGVIVTQVMPSPQDTSLAIIGQYQSDMKAAGFAEFDYTDLEGYIDAVVFIEVLKKTGPNLTRESFSAAAESLNVHIGGLDFAYSRNDHQALKKVYLTRISGGQAMPMK